MSEVEGTRNLIELIKKYKNNDELLEDLYKTKKINKYKVSLDKQS